jgi:hypothetical protein
MLPLDDHSTDRPPAVVSPIVRLPVEPQPDVPHTVQELIQDFDAADGEDLARWEGLKALLHHREPGLGGGGALEAALYPGASIGVLELRETLPASKQDTRTLHYSMLARQDGDPAPVLEAQFSEDGGETWTTAGHLTEDVPVKAFAVRSGPLSLR